MKRIDFDKYTTAVASIGMWQWVEV